MPALGSPAESRWCGICSCRAAPIDSAHVGNGHRRDSKWDVICDKKVDAAAPATLRASSGSSSRSLSIGCFGVASLGQVVARSSSVAGRWAPGWSKHTAVCLRARASAGAGAAEEERASRWCAGTAPHLGCSHSTDWERGELSELKPRPVRPNGEDGSLMLSLKLKPTPTPTPRVRRCPRSIPLLHVPPPVQTFFHRLALLLELRNHVTAHVGLTSCTLTRPLSLVARFTTRIHSRTPICSLLHLMSTPPPRRN